MRNNSYEFIHLRYKPKDLGIRFDREWDRGQKEKQSKIKNNHQQQINIVHTQSYKNIQIPDRIKQLKLQRQNLYYKSRYLQRHNEYLQKPSAKKNNDNYAQKYSYLKENRYFNGFKSCNQNKKQTERHFLAFPENTQKMKRNDDNDSQFNRSVRKFQFDGQLNYRKKSMRNPLFFKDNQSKQQNQIAVYDQDQQKKQYTFSSGEKKPGKIQKYCYEEYKTVYKDRERKKKESLGQQYNPKYNYKMNEYNGYKKRHIESSHKYNYAYSRIRQIGNDNGIKKYQF